LEVVGMVSIFTYDFSVAGEAFAKAGVKYHPLTNYPILIQMAFDKGIISDNQKEILLKWRNDPANWQGVL